MKQSQIDPRHSNIALRPAAVYSSHPWQRVKSVNIAQYDMEGFQTSCVDAYREPAGVTASTPFAVAQGANQRSLSSYDRCSRRDVEPKRGEGARRQ